MVSRLVTAASQKQEGSWVQIPVKKKKGLSVYFVCSPRVCAGL